MTSPTKHRVSIIIIIHFSHYLLLLGVMVIARLMAHPLDTWTNSVAWNGSPWASKRERERERRKITPWGFVHLQGENIVKGTLRFSHVLKEEVHRCSHGAEKLPEFLLGNKKNNNNTNSQLLYAVVSGLSDGLGQSPSAPSCSESWAVTGWLYLRA